MPAGYSPLFVPITIQYRVLSQHTSTHFIEQQKIIMTSYLNHRASADMNRSRSVETHGSLTKHAWLIQPVSIPHRTAGGSLFTVISNNKSTHVVTAIFCVLLIYQQSLYNIELFFNLHLLFDLLLLMSYPAEHLPFVLSQTNMTGLCQTSVQ